MSFIECIKRFGMGSATLLCGITLCILAFSSIGLGIADIVIGSKMDTCHIDSLDTYLIISGSLLLGYIIVNVLFGKDDNNNVHPSAQLISLSYVGIIIWGMSILWDTESGDCNLGQYNYAYYRTVVVMWIAVAVGGPLLVYGIITICMGHESTRTTKNYQTEEIDQSTV